jgi:peptide methionine sulfoxide reductase MsrA
MTRLAIVTVLSITTVFLASGCLWGVVRDTETGAGVAGATVSWTDSEGRSHSTVTDSGGL